MVAERLVVPICNSAKHSSDMFQGRNCVTSAGGCPSELAQAVRYQFSQSRGLIFLRDSVAKIENSIAVSRPDHSAPLP